MWIINLIFETIFPKTCFICKKEKEGICKRCLNNFSLCINQKNNYTYSHYSYRDINVQKIIKSIKYYHQRNLIRDITLPIINNISNFTDKENLLLVPIPMTTIRKYLRGYNQSEEITKIISNELNLPYAFDLLKRKKQIKRQVEVRTLSARLKNQKGCFILINEEKYKNKNIILIDDVITTGATIEEARNILIKNGFKNIKAITLAH